LIFPLGFGLAWFVFHAIFTLLGILLIAALVVFIIRAVTLGSSQAAWNSMKQSGNQWQQRFTGQAGANQQTPNYQPPQQAGQTPYYQPPQQAGQQPYEPYGQGYQSGQPYYNPQAQPYTPEQQGQQTQYPQYPEQMPPAQQ